MSLINFHRKLTALEMIRESLKKDGIMIDESLNTIQGVEVPAKLESLVKALLEGQISYQETLTGYVFKTVYAGNNNCLMQSGKVKCLGGFSCCGTDTHIVCDGIAIPKAVGDMKQAIELFKTIQNNSEN